MHIIDCESISSDDKDKDMCVAEFVGPSRAKSYSCSSLKMTQKNRQEEAHLTFIDFKCDCILDELFRRC